MEVYFRGNIILFTYSSVVTATVTKVKASSVDGIRIFTIVIAIAAAQRNMQNIYGVKGYRKCVSCIFIGFSPL